MNIQFYDDPLSGPNAREDVRIKQIGLYVYDDLRRMAFGVELTPFRERPSIEVAIVNGQGAVAGSLNVIDTLTPNFSLTMHFRDNGINNPYTLTTTLYYATPDTERQDIHTESIQFELVQPGEQIFVFAGK